ncbi:MAG: hypothetical protein AAB853_04035 [Patescibacteria group bacterium]
MRKQSGKRSNGGKLTPSERRGGGPKTSEGKEASRMNALRHGILSTHLFVPIGEAREYEDFVEFQIVFFEEMQPVGMLETLIVDRLFATFWRLRRLHIAETGFIRRQVEPHYMQQAFAKMEAEGVARRDIENGFFHRMRTSHGCSRLAEHWQAVYETLRERGLPLSKGMARAVDEELGGRSGFYKAECVSIFNNIVENNGGSKPMSANDKKQFDEWALTWAKDLWEFFRGCAEVLEWDERDVQKADLQSKMIPPLEELEKLQRYDAHLQRVLLQTLHELQRIQSARLGRPTPLPVAVDVTLAQNDSP